MNLSTTILRGVFEDSDGNILYFENNSDMIKHNNTTVNDELTTLDNKLTVYTTTHSGNDYSVTVPGLTTLTDLTDGYPLTVKFDANSSGNITVNPNGLKAIAVVDYFGAQVANVRTDLIASLRYEATSGNFQLQGKGGDGTAIAAHLLLNDTATTSTGKVIGTMPNNGPETQVISIKALTNLIINGNFENTGMKAATNTGYSTSYKKFGSYSLYITCPNATSENIAVTTNTIITTSGHIYYISCWVYATGAMSMQMYARQAEPSITVLVPATTWTFCSGTLTFSSTLTDNARLDNNSQSTTAYYDGFSVIDLTAAYGAGHEPTKAQMDVVMSSLGGWFDGTTLVEKILGGAYLNTGTTGSTEVITKSDTLIPNNIISNVNVLNVPGGIPINPGTFYTSLSGAVHIDSAGVALGRFSPDGLQRLYLRPGSAGTRQVLDGDTWISKEEPNLIPQNFLNTVTMFGLQGGIPVYANINQSGSQAGAGSPGIIYISPLPGYYTNANVYIQDPNYVASNIVSPASIFGLTGTATIESLGGVRYTTVSSSYTAGVTLTINFPFVPRVIVLATSRNMYYTWFWGSNGYNFVLNNTGAFTSYITCTTGNSYMKILSNYDTSMTVTAYIWA